MKGLDHWLLISIGLLCGWEAGEATVLRRVKFGEPIVKHGESPNFAMMANIGHR